MEINLAKTYPVLPNANEGQLRMFNGKSCDYSFSSNIRDQNTFSLRANEVFEQKFIKVDGEQGTSFTWKIESATPAACQQDVGVTKTFYLPEKSARSFFFLGATNENAPQVNASIFEDSAEKSRNGRPLIRVLANIQDNTEIRLLNEKDNERYNKKKEFNEQVEIASGTYQVFIGDSARNLEIMRDFEMKVGGVYTLIINERSPTEFSAKVHVISEPNSMNMLWLFPQYIVMTLGEVMFSITGLQFSFTQAPESMKSVLQGCWMVNQKVSRLTKTFFTTIQFSVDYRLRKSYSRYYCRCKILFVTNCRVFLIRRFDVR